MVIVVCKCCHRDLGNQPDTEGYCARCWPREEIARLARALITVMRETAMDEASREPTEDDAVGAVFEICIIDQMLGEPLMPELDSKQQPLSRALDALDSRLTRLGR